MKSVKAVVLLSLFFAAGCLPAAPLSGNLSFNTVENKNDAQYYGQQQYNALNPGLMLFADDAAMSLGNVWFSEAARQKLIQIDWKYQVVLAVFQGWHADGGHGVEVKQIYVMDGVLHVDADFQSSTDISPVGVTSPYHLVVLQRPENLSELKIVLKYGEEILELSSTPIAP